MIQFNSLFPRKEMYRLDCQTYEFGQRPRVTDSARARTRKIGNNHLLCDMIVTEEHGFPVMAAYTGPTDFQIFPYSQRQGLPGTGQALHFFAHDSVFRNAIDRDLEATARKLINFSYLFTPDLSLYVDKNFKHQNIHNIYLSRLAGAYFQHCGYAVIPTVSWAGADSFGYAFEGLPRGSVLAVCGTGHNRSRAQRELWEYGMRKAEEELAPTLMFVYGEEVEVPGFHTPLKFIPDYTTTHFRNEKRTRK